jgi:hypothetical protein
MAVLPTVSFGNATGTNIMGLITGIAVANGTGVMFTVNFTNPPDPMMYGPLGEYPLLALDLLQPANHMALQYTISINLRSPPTETALELWRISTLQIVVSCTLAKFKLLNLSGRGLVRKAWKHYFHHVEFCVSSDCSMYKSKLYTNMLQLFRFLPLHHTRLPLFFRRQVSDHS